jgi:rhodanese-related sulfurtransferase
MNIHPKDLARRLREPNPPRLLDVRQPEENAFASLPGTRLIPLDELPLRAGELRDWQGEEIVVYCHHGIRSLRAIGFLRQMGFERLLNLEGGIDAWSAEVDPSVPRY